ncbi:two-component system, chemotaxis family, response regulator CheV [Noviherbaspirillum humi]|uniref:Two-component system, chemotaxis family, response regulator CheV n=1 Tax=Noviherbaspirillum humi TaxID=1688639 RepID=A0A239ETW6_9BURK|nr:chemotaxis protein [Noviherbaspirillum humi]SNS48039.1 two-component system, chemotaxis family, response regulator CheV [Noviherbaspirillum humi]
MDAIQSDLEARTSLTANNKFELMLFRLGKGGGERSELYGINVFKVRELMEMPAITTIADASPYLLGMVNIRGQIIPVLDLPALAGCRLEQPPKILMVTEFARTVQAFAVEEVDDIVRLDWSQVKPAESCVAGEGTITSIAHLDVDVRGSSLVQVLDVEQILHRVFPPREAALDRSEAASEAGARHDIHVLAADDSSSARMMISRALDTMGIAHRMATSGQDAWNQLNRLAEEAEAEGEPLLSRVSLVLTDLEMPEMDGFTLTRKIKADRRFGKLPVIIHSSLTGDANEQHVKGAGADAYVAKFKLEELAAVIDRVLQRVPA